MDTRGFLDQILQSGKEMADKGQDFVENKFGMPAEGEQRDAMVSGMKKGALGGGLLALLLGTGGASPRRLSAENWRPRSARWARLQGLQGLHAKARW